MYPVSEQREQVFRVFRMVLLYQSRLALSSVFLLHKLGHTVRSQGKDHSLAHDIRRVAAEEAKHGKKFQVREQVGGESFVCHAPIIPSR